MRIKGTDEKGEDLPEDLTNKEIYKRMREGAFFKTSQLTYYDYFKEFEESAKEVICPKPTEAASESTTSTLMSYFSSISLFAMQAF